MIVKTVERVEKVLADALLLSLGIDVNIVRCPTCILILLYNLFFNNVECIIDYSNYHLFFEP